MKQRLATRLLNYFLLITIAAIMIGIEFFFEMEREGLSTEICSTIQEQVIKNDIKNQSEIIVNLRNKIVIMFGVLTLVVAIVMTMFIKNITLPLQKMSDAAEAINQGDLSRVIDIETHDEIGMVGNAINELTSNIQEVASFTCITATQALEKLNKLDENLKTNNNLSTDEVDAIRDSLNSLIEFSDSFQLLHTDIKNDS